MHTLKPYKTQSVRAPAKPIRLSRAREACGGGGGHDDIGVLAYVLMFETAKYGRPYSVNRQFLATSR